MGEIAILGERSPFEGLCYETFGTHLFLVSRLTKFSRKILPVALKRREKITKLSQLLTCIQPSTVEK